jgi:hypothetical protein
MLSIGSKCDVEVSWLELLRCAARGTGDGARLANCGSGEKEKFGLNGSARPPGWPLPVPLLVLGRFSVLLFGGGVKGGCGGFVGPLTLVSPGLGFEVVSERPASEGREVFTVGGYVVDVGVGSGADCV